MLSNMFARSIVSRSPRLGRWATGRARRPITMTYLVGADDPKTVMFAGLQDFRHFFGDHFLLVPNGTVVAPKFMRHEDIDPSAVYTVTSLYDTARRGKRTHTQIADKPFEEKAIQRLERHFADQFPNVHRRPAQDPSRENGWRYITDKSDVAEWGGIWEGEDGCFYVLEARHLVDPEELSKIASKLQRTIDFLKISRNQARLYVAGKYWGGEDLEGFAGDLGFWVMRENGGDLDVIQSSPVVVAGGNGNRTAAKGLKRKD